MYIFRIIKKYEFSNVGGAVDGAGDQDQNDCCYSHECQQQPLTHAHHPPAKTGARTIPVHNYELVFLFRIVALFHTVPKISNQQLIESVYRCVYASKYVLSSH